MVVVRMISPKTGFLSFGKVLVRLLLSVPSPFFLGIELTANQCQSVARLVVPLGCWV